MPGMSKPVSTQLTLTIAKPDAVRRGLVGKIISAFEAKGLELRALDFLRAAPEQIEENYRNNAAEPWFQEMVTYMTSGYIVPMAWQGQNAIDSARQIIGAKDPWESDAGSLRGDYAADPLRTVVHGSRDPGEAIREINLWFPSLLGPDLSAAKTALGAVEYDRLMKGVERERESLLIVKSYAPLAPDPPFVGQIPNLGPR